jgi:hypothetical protein
MTAQGEKSIRIGNINLRRSKYKFDTEAYRIRQFTKKGEFLYCLNIACPYSGTIKQDKCGHSPIEYGYVFSKCVSMHSLHDVHTMDAHRADRVGPHVSTHEQQNRFG